MLKFVDEQAMGRHPATFNAPIVKLLAAIEPGDFVKVVWSKKHFWLKVTVVNRHKIGGTVASAMVDLPRGAPVVCEKRHVLDVMRGASNI